MLRSVGDRRPMAFLDRRSAEGLTDGNDTIYGDRGPDGFESHACRWATTAS